MEEVFIENLGEALQNEMLEWHKKNPNLILIQHTDGYFTYSNFKDLIESETLGNFTFIFKKDYEKFKEWHAKQELLGHLIPRDENVEKVDLQTLKAQIPENVIYLPTQHKVLIFPISDSEEMVETAKVFTNPKVAMLGLKPNKSNQSFIRGENKLHWQTSEFRVTDETYLLNFIKHPRNTFICIETDKLEALIIPKNVIPLFMKAHNVIIPRTDYLLIINNSRYLIGTKQRIAFLRNQ